LHSPHVPSPDARGQLKLRSSAKNRPRLLNVRQELRLWAPQEACATLHTPPHESVGVDTGAFAAVGGSEAMVGGGSENNLGRHVNGIRMLCRVPDGPPRRTADPPQAAAGVVIPEMGPNSRRM